jgi:hypothetical protein
MRRSTVRPQRFCHPFQKRLAAGHVHPAQGVAQEGDGVDGARGREESPGGRDEGTGAGGLIEANATNGNES